MKHFQKAVAGILMVMVTSTLIHAASLKGGTDIDTYCLEIFSPRKYYFGVHGEGLVKVTENDNVLFDFGDKPNWFMLTYMHQLYYNNNLVTRSKYYYPETGSGNQLNNFSGYEVDIEDSSDPNWVIVTASYLFNNLDGTTAKLKFIIFRQIPSLEPVSDVWIMLDVDNKKEDTGTEVWRLMEVHCPFVRMPPVNGTQSDDVLVLGNNLLANPVKNLAAITEPYEEKDGLVKRHGQRYPNGTQMSMYYEKLDQQKSNGVYFSIVNLDHRTCEFNLWKRNLNNWNDWGYVLPGNRPSSSKFVIWDVVHYPENVNQPKNSHSTGLLLSHMRFGRYLDWYDGAQFRRNELKWWDDIDDKRLDCFNFSKAAIESQWPDYKLKDDPLTPVDAKLNALMVYISPQSANNRHDLCPPQGERPVINRIKEYERIFGKHLTIEDWPGIKTRLFASTWVGDYAEDTATDDNGIFKHREFYWNHPEWSTGGVPIDANLRDPDGQSYLNMFYRDNLHAFIAQLDNPDNNIRTRFICHNGPYNSHIENPVRFNDPDHLTKEYFRVPFYENPDHPRLKNKLVNAVNRYDWGADQSSNYNAFSGGYQSPDLPEPGWTNHEYYLGDHGVADAVYGSIFSVMPGSGQTDLAAGRVDSQFMSPPRWLGAGGVYAGVSIDYRPMYTNLRIENFFTYLPGLYSAIDFSFIPPGGSNLCYRIDKMKNDDMHANYPDVITLVEGFKLPHMENVDIFRSEIWPPQLFQSKSGPVSPVARQDFSRPIIDLQQQPPANNEGFIDLPDISFIPMETAIVHDYQVLMDGANAYIPYTFWHAYFKPAHYTALNVRDNTPENIYWTFYGGYFGENEVPDVGSNGFYRLEHAYEAYRADLAYSFTYGYRIMVFDVDRAVRESGEELYGDPDSDLENTVITDLYTEKTAKSTRSFLEHLISRYKAWGWPTIEDLAADSLFFGQLLRAPKTTTAFPPEFNRKLRYDPISNLAIFGDEHLNVTYQSPAVLTAFWKTNISDPVPSGRDKSETDSVLNDRLLFVMTNFTDFNDGIGGRSYRIKTKTVDLTQLLPNPGGFYYKFLYTPGAHTGVIPTLITNPDMFLFDETVGGNSTVLVGILTTNHLVIPGIYTRLDSDDNLDLILLDKDTGELSVVFGDGTHDYNPANAEFIRAGVKDIALANSDRPDQADLVILTAKGLELLSYVETSGFTSVLTADDVFVDASRIKTVHSDDETITWIVQDGSILQSVTIGASKSGKQAFFIDEIVSEPVRTFEITNLCSDASQNIVLISEDGSVEILSQNTDGFESMIMIEIDTSADTIHFDDLDLDSGTDIVLQESGTKYTETLQWVGGWKFVPAD